MKRTDIEITNSGKGYFRIDTTENFITFEALKGQNVPFFASFEMSMPMVDKLCSSKIVTVERCTIKSGSTLLTIKKEFGFTAELFQEVVFDLLEKYNIE